MCTTRRTAVARYDGQPRGQRRRQRRGAQPWHGREAQTITFAPSNRSGGFVSDTTKLAADRQTETIQIDTLDAFFYGRDEQPDFIKMDVEGFDGEIGPRLNALVDGI